MQTHVLPPVRMRGRMQANGGVVNCTSCWCSHTPAVISAPSRQPSKVRRHTNFESYSLHCWRSQSVKTQTYAQHQHQLTFCCQGWLPSIRGAMFHDLRKHHFQCPSQACFAEVYSFLQVCNCVLSFFRTKMPDNCYLWTQIHFLSLLADRGVDKKSKGCRVHQKGPRSREKR